ncbi:phage replisome organizer N-terminal domain-containing protein [Clostridium beijerinckii]|uniref:Phage replisome organizer n=1 Tax=Clostridium beijerinckii TaxID=1520 RepID=A0A1S9N4L5_CLOBE|nr:phage replisome organizer N-terminal domain-containing protein [Clostridium beijerinckii]MZK51464.1 DnaD domain protein [Clostridium beijerinckii]MZK59664.1 DnaD domain protein [Clostridium beijerinckii]MZK69784.1 DnaD domain protein [Clostridium beijerinckii]MZK75162.1 DnaD domain protein [Clostridium beijerinckii]MZK84874.1 DnaD domain protein [Clostridium beijerinckii]
MSDIKWIKLSTNMHDDEKMKLVDAMPERDTIHYLWIRLLIQAGKTNDNGLIYLNGNIPYTDEMLSTIFSRPLASIRLALKVLSDFQMIEIAENNVIRIVNWERHQNVEGMDRVREQNRKRVQNHREKKKQLEAVANEIEEHSCAESKEYSIEVTNDSCDSAKKYCNVTDDKSNVTVTVQNKRENKNKIKNENNKDREIKKEENIGYDANETPTSNAVYVSDLHNRQAFRSLIKETYIPNAMEVSDSHEITDFSSLLKSESAKSSVSQSKDSIDEQDKNLEDINSKSIELAKYCEIISGIPNVLNLGALKLAIGVHGQEYVKMAIDIALIANKSNMTYIDGILKNWRREGYPDDKKVKKNVNRSYGKNSSPDKNKFAGFKPKEPRRSLLTDEQRKKALENLI